MPRICRRICRRLRDAAQPSDEDLALLGVVLTEHGNALDEVVERLHGIGLPPTTCRR
jgi:hypothetical protein